MMGILASSASCGKLGCDFGKRWGQKVFHRGSIHSTQELVDENDGFPSGKLRDGLNKYAVNIHSTADVRFQCFDDVVHFAGFFEIVFDFVDGMQDSRVVTGENLADFR